MDRVGGIRAVATLAPVSSLATAPQGAAPGDPRATHSQTARTRRGKADPALAVGLAAGLCVVVFAATGGTALAPNTWTQITLALIGAALGALVLLRGAPGPAWGAVTLLLFAALLALTAISIAWSVQPDNSWLETNRTLSYLAAFGGAIALARLFPERWSVVLGAIALFATVVCGYALLVKVFPASLDPQQTLGRLVAPLGFWNATGLIGALGLPACLWIGASRELPRSLRSLSVPAIALSVTVVVLSYSRSALLAAILGAACWFAFVPLRLRGSVLFALGGAGAAVLTGWALLTHALTHDKVALSSRTSAGHTFGVVLVLVLLAQCAVGALAASTMDRTQPDEDVRRRVGRWLIALVVIVPLAAGAAVLASSSRGVTGEISHVWSTLTSQTATVSDNPGRLGELASTRARDWSEGLKVGEHALLNGVGALGFGTARNRYPDIYPIHHAHSYVIETFADFGLIGLALNLALLVSWGLAASRPLGWRRTRGGSRASGTAPAGGDDVTSSAGPASAASGHVAERAGMLTMLAVVVAFGAQSSIDWTWFIPGTALPALLCAGWLAGRGPLAQPVGRRARRRSLSKNPATGAALAGLAAVTLLGAWAIWQPLRSTDASSAAISAATRGEMSSALSNARAAVARDPLALSPRFELSALLSAVGDPARAELVKATDVQPQNADSWLQLGTYDLQHRRPQVALAELGRAHQLDVNSNVTAQELTQAVAAIQPRQAGR